MDFIDDFIEEYKSNPCLWKADSVDFKNKVKRQEAYSKLIDVATKHGELYNVERTKQKINNLRCAFRHQLRKYNEVKKKGEKYEPYCPKRRYFESLMFLKDEEIPDKKSKRNINPPAVPERFSENIETLIQNENGEELSDTESISKQMKQKNNTTEYCSVYEEADSETNINIEPMNTNHPSGATIKEVEILVTSEAAMIAERRKSLKIPKAIQEVNSAGQRVDLERDKRVMGANKQNRSIRKRSVSVSSQLTDDNDVSTGKFLKTDISSIDFERLFSLALKSVDSHLDDHDHFGKIVSHKLRCMDPTQAIYAEKIIADVLYQGQMKMLSTLSIHQFLSADNSSAYYESHNK